MSDTKSTERNARQTKSSKSAEVNPGQSAETLYQRLGDKWYAFSLIDDEVFVGSIEEKDLSESGEGSEREIRAYRITGNS